MNKKRKEVSFLQYVDAHKMECHPVELLLMNEETGVMSTFRSFSAVQKTTLLDGHFIISPMVTVLLHSRNCFIMTHTGVKNAIM